VPRPVDAAMGENRPEKETMRRLWVEAVSEAGVDPSGPPLYLTLPGAHGLDVQRLIDAQLLRLAENGAVAPEDSWKVVAVESNNEAFLALKRRLPGLRVLNENIRGILSSTGPLTWPRGKNEDWCRAHVVNLDLESALGCERDASGGVVFPTVQLIVKLAQLHLKEPALDWVLCLTLAARVEWTLDDCEVAQRFLRENFKLDDSFAADSRALLGDRLFDALMEERPLDLTVLSDLEQQSLLMVLVPKKIVAETYRLGWRVSTTHNLRYGGHSRSQRMVSWVMQFTREPRVAAEPLAVYGESLAEILARVGAVDAEGVVRRS
jgi:hypothetical protein